MVAGSAAQIIGCGFVADSVLDEGGSRFFHGFEFVNGFKLARVAALYVNHFAFNISSIFLSWSGVIFNQLLPPLRL